MRTKVVAYCWGFKTIFSSFTQAAKFINGRDVEYEDLYAVKRATQMQGKWRGYYWRALK